MQSDSYEIDLNVLELVVKEAASRGHPVLVVFTCGTTVGHAIDNIAEGSVLVENICKDYNVPFWIHVDAALQGAIVPYMDDGQNMKFDFVNPQVCSMNVSGHKHYGQQWTSGVLVMRSELRHQ